MSNIGDGLNAYVDNLGPELMTEIEQGYLEYLEAKNDALFLQEGESAGRYVERQIMDIFQRVAEFVGDGLFELDHPAPIIRGAIVMTNAWSKYLLTGEQATPSDTPSSDTPAQP